MQKQKQTLKFKQNFVVTIPPETRLCNLSFDDWNELKRKIKCNKIILPIFTSLTFLFFGISIKTFCDIMTQNETIVYWLILWFSLILSGVCGLFAFFLRKETTNSLKEILDFMEYLEKKFQKSNNGSSED